MPTLLLRLAGPMQSWGITSRFEQRDTATEPSKSGVIGLLAAASGIDRANWLDLEPLARLLMGVRRDRPGVPKRDYQTAGCSATDTIIRADRTQSPNGVVSHRFYLADAVFLVALEGDSRPFLEKLHAALSRPAWLMALGRKSYVPSEPVWIENGVKDIPLLEALKQHPWIATPRKWENPPDKLLISYESGDGSGVLRMDQPLSSFAERRFGARLVRSEWVSIQLEAGHVSQ